MKYHVRALARPAKVNVTSPSDHFPFFIRNADTLAQGCLQKPALNQGPSPQSSFVHEAYNTRRRHSYLGGISPLAFETTVA